MKEQLEKLIDQQGLSRVLEDLGEVCLEHARKKTIDDGRTHWAKMSDDIEKLARRAFRFKMGS